MAPPAIVLRDLTKRFGPVTAVEQVSLEVAPGATVALLGGNGAGKTTTLSILLGLVLPTSGEVRVFGEDMLRHRYRVLHRMNFSSPYVDLPMRLTVGENLRVYGRLYGVPRLEARLAQVGRELEIAAFFDRPYRQLSAGQRTRVALAKALLNEPDLLVMDEPTASLDPDIADYVRGYLRDYQRNTGATLFFASHNMNEVERMCSEVILMRTGRVVDRGAPRALIARYGRQNMEEVFIDVARRREDTPPGDAEAPPTAQQREAAR